jgi:hypothetical protein
MFYNVEALPAFQYGSRSWAITEIDINKIQLSEIRDLITVKACTGLNYIKEEDIGKKLKMQYVPKLDKQR